MLKATRKAKRISAKERPTVHDFRQMISYLGWIKCTATYAMYLKWIKPYVSFQKMKRRISRCDKKDPFRMYLQLAALYTIKGG